MRLAISVLLSKKFQLFVKKKCRVLMYTDRGIYPDRYLSPAWIKLLSFHSPPNVVAVGHFCGSLSYFCSQFVTVLSAMSDHVPHCGHLKPKYSPSDRPCPLSFFLLGTRQDSMQGSKLTLSLVRWPVASGFPVGPVESVLNWPGWTVKF